MCVRESVCVLTAYVCVRGGAGVKWRDCKLDCMHVLPNALPGRRPPPPPPASPPVAPPRIAPHLHRTAPPVPLYRLTADVPYDLTPEFLHELFTKHRIDYVLHGDDPCLLPDGTDAYEHAKRLGRFKMVRR